jgi:hypothetical protein
MVETLFKLLSVIRNNEHNLYILIHSKSYNRRIITE